MDLCTLYRVGVPTDRHLHRTAQGRPWYGGCTANPAMVILCPPWGESKAATGVVVVEMSPRNNLCVEYVR